MINNTNCGISVSPSALVFNPASGRYDAPNSLDISFEDILVDNRGQGKQPPHGHHWNLSWVFQGSQAMLVGAGRMSGDDMAGVQITGTPPALRGTIAFNRLRVIGGNSPAFLAWATASDGVRTTVRDARFEHNSNGGLDWRKSPRPLCLLAPAEEARWAQCRSGRGRSRPAGAAAAGTAGT